MTGEWMATPWSIAHQVGAGRLLCGTDLPMEALQPSATAVRCGLCEVVAAGQDAPPLPKIKVRLRPRPVESAPVPERVEPKGRARPAPTPRPVKPARPTPAGPRYVGVDPFVAVLQRYERGQL